VIDDPAQITNATSCVIMFSIFLIGGTTAKALDVLKVACGVVCPASCVILSICPLLSICRLLSTGRLSPVIDLSCMLHAVSCLCEPLSRCLV
jgi:hypothetical protein